MHTAILIKSMSCSLLARAASLSNKELAAGCQRNDEKDE
jgi:hypothetical protein